jgi:hypothetical protein
MILFCKSCLLLLRIGFLMKFRAFSSLHDVVRRQRVHARSSHSESVDQLCRALDLACVFYLKPVLCLQRSSAATILLRRYGIGAKLVIGTQMLPFKSHAWVEVDGIVVNDKPYMAEIYLPMESC